MSLKPWCLIGRLPGLTAIQQIFEHEQGGHFMLRVGRQCLRVSDSDKLQKLAKAQ